MAKPFGRYWLHEKIGHGGMAEIFRASVGPNPQSFAFEVAIKRLHRQLVSDKTQVDMFLTETDVTKFLHHPNILRVFEGGFIEEAPYLAMEYVWGIDLARTLDLLRARRGRFPVDLTVYLGMQILRGLDYAHRALAPGGEPMTLIHRDVTPSNIFATFSGDVKLGDFGIARVSFIEPRDEGHMLKGKVKYVPPEVLGGEPIGQTDDLWALGLCMYEMLAMRSPYYHFDDEDLRLGLVSMKVPPITDANPDVDKYLTAILKKALHNNPHKRYQDAASFYKDLKGYLRTLGTRVTQDSMGQFIRAATGTSIMATQPRTNAESEFERPTYSAPAGPSLTQRFEAVRRRRKRVWPTIVGAVSIVACGLALWLIL